MTDIEARRSIRHRLTRESIVRAAWELAERDGIAGLSLREVAASVGMRPPSIYTYFESKDDLYDALFVDANRQLTEMFDGLVLPEDPVERLVAGVDHWIEFCQRSVARYQILYTRAVPGWTPSEVAYAVAVEAYEQMAAAAAAAGIRGQEALDLYTALTGGLAAQQLANDPGGDRWRRLAPRAIRMLIQEMGRT